MKFHVGLVHNFGDRFAEAVALHESVIAKLRASGFAVSASMHGEQTPAVDPGPLRGFKQQLAHSALKRKYCRRTLEARSIPTIRKQFSKALVAANRQERLKMWVDGEISRKHSEIWRDSNRNNADWVVVLEDDALPKPGWEVRIDNLVEDLVSFRPQYVDLAGGFKTETVTSHRSFVRKTSSGVLFAKVMTNTSCGYAMGRDFVERALKHFESFPNKDLVAIDTFVNDLSTVGKTTESQRSLHTSPTIFAHGSMTGDFESWR